jgi:phosphinothricin acetyltransferase
MVGGLQIRDATAADLPGILEITNDAILHSTALWTITPMTLQARREWLEDRRANGLPVLVAEQDGRVAGFGSYGPFRPHEGFVHTIEHSLYVHRDARRGGIGRALLASLVASATQAGKHVMIGAIEAQNTASITLHEKAGFERSALLPQVGRKFGRWLDLLLMQKQLASVHDAGRDPMLDAAPPNADPADRIMMEGRD